MSITHYQKSATWWGCVCFNWSLFPVIPRAWPVQTRSQVPGKRWRAHSALTILKCSGAYRGTGMGGSELWPLEVPEAVCLSVRAYILHAPRMIGPSAILTAAAWGKGRDPGFRVLCRRPNIALRFIGGKEPLLGASDPSSVGGRPPTRLC